MRTDLVSLIAAALPSAACAWVGIATALAGRDAAQLTAYRLGLAERRRMSGDETVQALGSMWRGRLLLGLGFIEMMVAGVLLGRAA